MNRLSVLLGDITDFNTDAIVNSAHSSLRMGSGLCGHIHKKAGKELENECIQKYGGCKLGEAVITNGYNLLAKFVIHTVGPKWYDKISNKAENLYSCYYKSLELADKNGLKSIAFPSISTGVHAFPVDLAAPIAISAICDFLEKNHNISAVYLVCNNNKDSAAYQKALIDHKNGIQAHKERTSDM